MENTVTLSLVEYEMLAGIKKDFDEKLKSELKRLNDADRAFVLRDRDEYVRRAELLFKEKTDAQKTFLDEINRLRRERNRAWAQYDALLGRGLFARIFNRG